MRSKTNIKNEATQYPTNWPSANPILQPTTPRDKSYVYIRKTGCDYGNCASSFTDYTQTPTKYPTIEPTTTIIPSGSPMIITTTKYNYNTTNNRLTNNPSEISTNYPTKHAPKDSQNPRKSSTNEPQYYILKMEINWKISMH
eukprot:135525_1